MKQKEDAASMQMSRRKFEQLMGTEKRKRGKRKARQRKAKHGNANQQQACVKAQEKKHSLFGWEWDKAIGESVAMFVPVVSFDLWDKKSLSRVESFSRTRYRVSQMSFYE